jgi:N utilization substance protein A
MGWRIDIKSEEEKRQEVEAEMSAMAGSGTPVSVLIDHGVPEEVVDRLIEAGSATVEGLADMTPEQLERIPEMSPAVLEQIQLGVNGYYAQFEAPEMPETDAAAAFDAVFDSADEAAEAAKGKAGLMALPGLPVEGADQDDDDDEEIPLEDFDTMERSPSYKSPTSGRSDDEFLAKDEDSADDNQGDGDPKSGERSTTATAVED